MAFQVLLIGLGKIGLKYDLGDDAGRVETHARAFKVNPDFELACAVDPSAESRRQLWDAYRVPAFEDVPSACRSVSPDLVVIASPTDLHAEHLGEVLSHSRPRAVLLEKPASHDREQVLRMIQRSNQCSVPVLVNLIRRADPAAQEIRERIRTGSIRTPAKGVVWYSRGILHNGCHFIDLLSWWLGAPGEVALVEDRDSDQASDAQPDIRIRFGACDFFFIATPQDAGSYHGLEAICENGRLVYEQGGRKVRWEAWSGQDGPEEIHNDLNSYQLNVSKDLARYLSEGRTVLPSLEEHLGTLNVIYDYLEDRRH